MKAILDLSKSDKKLFSGKKNGASFLDQVQGDGFLLIKVSPNQLVTSSFMFGLLCSNRFQDVSISEGPFSFSEDHLSEVKRATERYAKLNS